MSEREPLKFSLKLEEIPVVLSDPFTGEEREYILREMTGRQRDSYMTSISSKMEVNESTGKAIIKSFDGIEASLICRCLFTKDKEKNFVPVSEDEVQQFPSRVLKQLHTVCREISGLEEEDDEDTGKK